ncbi:MAG: AbrB/MazE/SpoVT family DNA-binding domain-containing protein [Thermomicrobiales bacterium]|nr:AbrB/MazE/SpoVT family DNA-binding domain-containing protein [Thermomicrobiales bacterium]
MTTEKLGKAYYTSSVSPKGQITLPVELRRRLDIEPQDVVIIELKSGSIQIEKAESRLLSGFGAVPVPESDRDWKTIERDAFDDSAERTLRKSLDDRPADR